MHAGENFVPRGSEARAGDVVLPAGTVMGAAEIALAAACGWAELEVFERPKVAIVATGDELVELDEVPEVSADSQLEQLRACGAGGGGGGEAGGCRSLGICARMSGSG